MTVSLAKVRTRVISLLQANRLDPYSGTVGTGSGANSRYQVDQEINDTILEADSVVCLAIIETSGHPYAAQFLTSSGNLTHGTVIPAHIGEIAKVTVDATPSRQTKSLTELLEVKANAALYPSATKYHFLEGGYAYNTGTNVVVVYPAFTKTAACQAHEVYEAAVVCLTIALLAKDGSLTPELYSTYSEYADRYLGMIKEKQETIPELEQVERAVAA